MEQRKLRFIKCECGNNISARALARHLRAKRFKHSEIFINKCIELIELNKKNIYAWKISEGVDALRDDYWCVKALNGELFLNELTFISPRKQGEGTPTSRKKISEERKGKGNPSLKNKSIYDFNKLKEFATVCFENLFGDPQKFSKLNVVLNKNFPDYKYSFAGMFPSHNGPRGHNRGNTILSFLINRSIEWIVSEKASDRGNFISKGQRNSPLFNKIQNAGRKGLGGRVTIPHRVLYNMVLSIDKDAKLEKQIDHGETWKSYDIFSPSKNILIEMHGRAWHDIKACKSNMVPLVIENVKNDEIKTKLAKDNGYEVFTFWDDECDTWEHKLENIYGKKPKRYEKALREEIDKKAKRRSI